jgi:hypothetical protein
VGYTIKGGVRKESEMIFQYSYEKVLDGTKSQTRRIVKPGESPLYLYSQADVPEGADGKILIVKSAGRTKWQLGLAYAAQPGRTKKAVGHIVIKSIRQERLQDVSGEDVRAEGFRTREEFHETWNKVHTKRGRRWEDSPLVWVLEFELVG